MKNSATNITGFIIVMMLLGSAKVGAEQEPLYQGKTIKIIVGFTSGGFYDRWSRLLARFVPKYLPGNPEMIGVTNAHPTRAMLFSFVHGDGIGLRPHYQTQAVVAIDGCDAVFLADDSDVGNGIDPA